MVVGRRAMGWRGFRRPINDYFDGRTNININPSDGIRIRKYDVEKLLIDNDGNVFIGSDLSAAATTTIAVFTGGQTYNGEATIGDGDLIIGDNSTSPSSTANIYWDKSEGKLQFRGGQTMQCEIGTDGKLYAGAGDVLLDANGITLLGGSDGSNRLKWGDGEGNNTCTIYSYQSTGKTITYFDNTGLDGTYPAVSLYITALHYNDATKNASIEMHSGATPTVNLRAYEVHINTTTDNANMTVGLTINQGTNDDEILALKSTTDVAHGMTTLAETDTFGAFLKTVAASGGLDIAGYTAATIGLRLIARGVTDDTTKSTAGSAYCQIVSQKKSGTSAGDPGADANLLAIRKDTATVAIVDVEGDLWLNGALSVNADHAGIAGSVTLTNQVNTSVSSGAGSILMCGATNRNSAGFVKQMNGTTAIYIPFFTTITG